jgi:adenine-specific DNA-methyltransferase
MDSISCSCHKLRCQWKRGNINSSSVEWGDTIDVLHALLLNCTGTSLGPGELGDTGLARLEHLLGYIADSELRYKLAKEVTDLKSRVRFGLVYERHLPETVIIRDIDGLKIGDYVRPRERLDVDEDFRVAGLDGTAAKIVSAKTGHELTTDLSDLRLICRFGDATFTGLKPIETLQRSKDRPFHTVIDGENYHALQALTFSLKGQVDCIYLDPPFNTGARDWKYNNRYVDENDSYRHSKWLSFMEKRLRLAKPLLKKDGVLIVMIDEHELHHLGMLLEELFPKHLIYMISIVINSRGSTGKRNFGIVEEQALFIVPDLGYDLIEARESFIPDLTAFGRESEAECLLAKLASALPNLAEQLKEKDEPLESFEIKLLKQLARKNNGDDKDEKRLSGSALAEYWRGAVRTGQATSYRTQRTKQFYPLYIDESSKSIVSVGEALLKRDKNGNLAKPSWRRVNGLLPVWPVDEEGRERTWCYEPSRMRVEIAKGNLKVGKFNRKRNTYAINVRRERRTEQRFREITVWWEKSYDAGSNGTNILRNILGESGTFPFPKSVYAVRDTLATVIGQRPNALVLDFFAGSGTTFHAVCLLNAIDGGSRRTVLVTNNEVESSEAERLAKEGVFPGDDDYERQGLFEKVTAPRIKAVVEGRRPDGTPIPGRHKWAGGRPFADGFEENVEFFRLDYLNPIDVEVGQCLDAIHPLLWLSAGCGGPRPKRIGKKQSYIIAPDCGYAILLKEEAFPDFEEQLAKYLEITHVYFVTDSDEAFAEMSERVGHNRVTSMLYGEYLRNFHRRLR